MIYRVTKRYGRGAESNVGSFKSHQEAKSFIQTAIEEDLILKVNAIYSIYEGADLLEEMDTSQMQSSSKQEEGPSSQSESQGQSQGSGQRFSPSPLSMKPQPKGMPISSWKDEPHKDESDKGTQ